jgi:hypothetical protein
MPTGQRLLATTADGTPDNSDLRGGMRRCPGEGRCSFPSEHCRASRRTSGTTGGATRDCPFAPCTRQAAARLLVMAVTLGRHRVGCGSPGGIALRAVERFSLLPDFLAARRPGLLASIEHNVTVALSAKSMEAAADPRTRGHVAQRRALAAATHSSGQNGSRACEAANGDRFARETAGAGDRCRPGMRAARLRRSLSPQILNRIAPPLGFRAGRGCRATTSCAQPTRDGT